MDNSSIRLDSMGADPKGTWARIKQRGALNSPESIQVSCAFSDSKSKLVRPRYSEECISTECVAWSVHIDSVQRRWQIQCHHQADDDLLLKSVHVLEDLCLDVEGFDWESQLSQSFHDPESSVRGTLRLRGRCREEASFGDVAQRLRDALLALDRWDDFVCLSDESDSMVVPPKNELDRLTDQWQRRGEYVICIRNAECTPAAMEEILDHIHGQGLALRSAEIITGGSNNLVVTPDSPSCPCAECLTQAQHLWAAAQIRSLHTSFRTTLILGIFGSSGEIVCFDERFAALRELCTQLGGPDCSVDVFPPKPTPLGIARSIERCRTCSGSSTCISSDSDDASSPSTDAAFSVWSNDVSLGTREGCGSCTSDHAVHVVAASAPATRARRKEFPPAADDLAEEAADAIQSAQLDRFRCVISCSISSPAMARDADDQEISNQQACLCAPVLKTTATEQRFSVYPDLERVPVHRQDSMKSACKLKAKNTVIAQNISLVSDEAFTGRDNAPNQSRERIQSSWRNNSKARNRCRSEAWPPSSCDMRSGERFAKPTVTPTTSSDAVGITLGSCRPTCTPQNLFIADIPQIRVQSQDSNRFQINVLTCSRPGIAFDLVCAFRALNVVIQRASVTVTDCVDSQDALPLTDAAPVEPRVCAQFLIQMPGAPDPQTPSERNLAAIGSNTALIETQLCSMLLDALCNPVCMHNRDDSAMTCVELHSYARDGQLVDLLRFMHAARLRVRRARVRTHGVRVRNLLYLTDMVMQKAVPSILWADLRAQILATTLGVDCLALIYPASADQRTAELSGVA